MKSDCRKDIPPALKRNVFEKPRWICMKDTPPKFSSLAAKSTFAYAFGGLLHMWPSKISLLGGSLQRLGNRGPQTMVRSPGFKPFLFFLSKAELCFRQAHKSWQTTSGFSQGLPCPGLGIQNTNTSTPELGSLNHILWMLSDSSFWKWVLNTGIGHTWTPALALPLWY